MKKWQLIAVACVLVTGCAGLGFAPPPPDPTRPQVSVVGDRFVVVNAEPLVFLKDQRNVTITWQLPRDSKYRFVPKVGIDIERTAEGEFDDCDARGGGLEFSCVNRHTKPGRYKYKIRLMGAAGGSPSTGRLEVDPFIMNE